jgi:hypothetical protein
MAHDRGVHAAYRPDNTDDCAEAVRREDMPASESSPIYYGEAIRSSVCVCGNLTPLPYCRCPVISQPAATRPASQSSHSTLAMAADCTRSSDFADHDPSRIVTNIAPFLRIAHQISGRVRLKLDAVPPGRPFPGAVDGEQLKRLFSAVPGVRGLSLNLLARSCVVEYDSAIIPDSAWPDLLAGRPTAAAQTLLGLLADIPLPPVPKEPS